MAPNGDVPGRSFAGGVRGLPVSLRGFTQDLRVQGLVGHQLLESSLLFLQGPQLRSVVRRVRVILFQGFPLPVGAAVQDGMCYVGGIVVVSVSK